MGNRPTACTHAGRGARRAGESSRKPRRPRPYSRALAGISLRSALCAKRRPSMQTPHGLSSDAACRVMIKNSPALCRREPHFYQLARLATAILVGAVPSVASARPNSAASRPKTPHRTPKTPHRPRNPERRPGRAGKSSRKPRRPRPYSWRGYHCVPNAAHQCSPRPVL